MSRDKRIAINENYRRNLRRRMFCRNRDAVSNIVTSIMMLGIVFTILGMILTVYVPIWAKGIESQHMEGVANSFTDLKSTIDTQIAHGDVDTKMTTRVKLGTEGGPLLGLGQSTGGIEFQPAASTLQVFNTDDAFEKYGTGRGKIVFDSNNIYYVDQKYIYENGAVILDQVGSNLMKVEPNFYITNVSGTTQFSVVMIMLQGDLENLGGIKSQTIQSILLAANKDTVEWGEGALPGTGRNMTITVNTSYPIVWHQYFTDILSNRSKLDETEYTVYSPVIVGDPQDEIWQIEVEIRDVNRLTTTLAYVDIGIN